MQFISTLLLLAASSVCNVYAAPKPLDRRIPDMNTLLSRYASPDPANTPSSMPASACDVASAKLPQAPVPLAAPSEGLVLTLVVLGRGTQNYTCANSTAAPAAAGAIATLYNGSCIAGPYPQLLTTMAGISLKLPVPASTGAAAAFLAGHHYFPDLTTPTFDFETALQPGAGKVGTKKLADTKAPNPTEDVPWLKLQAKSTTGQCNVQEVYRVNTRGGVAPKTCEGQPAAFQVQYAAEYWFYSTTA